MATKPETFVNIISVIKSCDKERQLTTAENMVEQFEKIYGGEREWIDHLYSLINKKWESFQLQEEECVPN